MVFSVSGDDHRQPPRLFAQRRHRDQIAALDELGGLAADAGHELVLLARRHVVGLDPRQRGLPVVAQLHLAGRLLHFLLAPGELPLADGDQLIGRVRQPLAADAGGQGLGPDRRAHQRIVVLALHQGHFLAEILGVVVELLGRVVVGLLQPPGEVGLVAVVERVPAFQQFLQVMHRARRTQGNRRGSRLAARLGHLLAEPADGG